ncbi:hypothetical protein [Aestuariibaculum marinum]|uniref:Uncharacterized protein n=1 Tax=Aestuariibaculum marinum TaxID=2683592 RepID=A0A8J6UDL1_9FLAO|nr:hypothetical protein [Aestuariibaculum marinum]MBD0825508.1 hypothetical protein [Aestuariibaculum marinum]
MKKKTILSKKIIRDINNSINDSDSKLDVNFLNEEKYYNYEIEEWYGEEFGIKGELRKKIIETLIKTYFEWKKELDELNKEYYLAIWLYNPRMLKSEIVCAIDEKAKYYENESFLASNKNSEFDLNQFGVLSTELQKFTWDRKIDLDSVHEWEINFPKEQYESEKKYNQDQKFYNKLIREKFHVVEKDKEKIYFHPKGDVWIGKLN